MTVKELINYLEKFDPESAVVTTTENTDTFDNIAVEQIKASPQGFHKGQPKFYTEDFSGEEVVLIKSVN